MTWQVATWLLIGFDLGALVVVALLAYRVGNHQGRLHKIEGWLFEEVVREVGGRRK